MQVTQSINLPPGCHHVSIIINQVMNELITGSWSEAISQANTTFEAINKRGGKWRNRTVPIFIRKNLFIPWYVIPDGKGNYRLFVIRKPTVLNPKVHFIEFKI